MTNTQSPAPGVAAEAWNELRSIRAGLDAHINLDSNYGCVGCGQWNPHGHKEGHGHDDGCPELARVIAESDARTRLDALLTALQASAAAVPDAPVGYQRLVNGKWEYCSAFVACGFGDMPTDGSVRKLYAAPPLPAPVQAAEVSGEKAYHDGRGAYELATLKTGAPGFHDLHVYEKAFWVATAALASRTPAPGMAGGVGAENPLIPWRGTDDSFDGPLPEGTIADLKFRSGEVICGCKAWDYTWRDRGAPDDIVAYRVSAAPHPSPAPQAAGAEDAARYQLIRAGNLYAKHRPVYEAIVEGFTGPELDSAVDAAITAAGRAGS